MALIIGPMGTTPHAPKHGGSTLTGIVQDAMGDQGHTWEATKRNAEGWRYTGHQRLRDIPAARIVHPVIAPIRGPWQWAASFFFHFRGDEWTGDGTKFLSQFHQSGSFRPVLRGMFLPSIARGNCEGWPIVFGFPPLVDPEGWKWMISRGVGLWTYLVNQAYFDEAGRCLVDHWVRTHNLGEDLGEIWDGLGYPAQYGDLARCYPPANVSGRYTPDDLGVLYTEELVDLVEHQSSELLCHLADWGVEFPRPEIR